MTLKFVPPKEPRLPRYASYGAGEMKTHTSLGAAKLSLGHRCGNYSWYRSDASWKEGFILELIDGEWYIRFHVKEGTKDDELPWKKEAWIGRRYGYTEIRFTEPTYRPEDYKKTVISVPETKEEYADWRVRVELEKRGIVD